MPIPAFLGSLEVLFRCFMLNVTKLLQTAEVLLKFKCRRNDEVRMTKRTAPALFRISSFGFPSTFLIFQGYHAHLRLLRVPRITCRQSCRASLLPSAFSSGGRVVVRMLCAVWTSNTWRRAGIERRRGAIPFRPSV